MKRLLIVVALLVPLVAAGAVAGAWWWVDNEMDRPFGPDGDDAAVVVEFSPGTPAITMLQRLGEVGVLRDPRLVRIGLKLDGGAEGLRAGEYRFDRPASPRAVLGRLRAGDVLLHQVTIPEGWRFDQIATHVASVGLADEATLLEVFTDPSPIAAWAPDALDLEGYLFPDTYAFPRSADALDIRDAMLARFRAVVEADVAPRAAAVGFTVAEAVTLASLIEKETSVPDERPRISRVFHNRLEQGMLLQCDPTSRYAWHRQGVEVERLLFKHLELDSPWNTYVSPGLPPGPIASPGRESLVAAVQPAEGDELYFVAAPDGGHTFSGSLAEHNRAVAVWRRYRRTIQ